VFDFDFVARSVSHYVAWLKQVTYIVLWMSGESGEPVFRYFRSPKRGDFHYAWHVNKRFADVEPRVVSKPFFTFGCHGIVRSRCLLLTATYGRTLPLVDAWRSRVGIDFNRWLSYLRKKYGKLSVVRCWESHLDGYPHVHALVYFQESDFKCFSHIGLKGKNKGKLSYRVFSSSAVKRGWAHGHVDVLAMSSVHAGFSYIGKYLRKSVQISGNSKNSNVVKTLALCWRFHKRAFSVSGDWSLAPSDLIVAGTNSNSVSDGPGFSQVVFDSGLVEWSLFGIFMGDHVLLGSDGGDLEISGIDALFDAGLKQR